MGVETEILRADGTGVARAAALLRAGSCVAFPTETVYGLGARADDPTAVAGIFEAKARPAFNPLIVHVVSLEAAAAIAQFPPEAERLAAAFWPGPLTLVLPLGADAGIAEAVTADKPTLALRVPENALARQLLQEVGLPIAAPSANPSGRVSPTTAAHVIEGLSGRIAAVLDGGPCAVGLESTIVGIADTPKLLRPGGLPTEAIEACLGQPLAMRSSGGSITAPGQLASHYAPRATLRLNAKTARPGEVFLGFGPGDFDENLSQAGDLPEAAARLFAMLRALDENGAEAIAVSPIPDHGLGRAINDRLRRAAAPRP
ncbi:MAG: L-threonylcarbamoyladenylate synthase [Pseudomonadota bacterium]